MSKKMPLEPQGHQLRKHHSQARPVLFRTRERGMKQYKVCKFTPKNYGKNNRTGRPNYHH